MKKIDGFTLIELVVVVAIIAVLSAIAFASYQDYVARSQAAAGLSDILSGQSAFESKLVAENITTYDVSALGLRSTTTRCAITLIPGPNGYIRCTLAGTPAVAGRHVTLQRRTSSAWQCITDIPAEKHRPAGCAP